MHRALVSGPIVWCGIIVTTCLLLVIFQYVLWLVVPVMLAIVANYLLSPLVDMAIARGLTRSRAVLVVTILLTIFIVVGGLLGEPRISAFVHDLPNQVEKYADTANRLVVKARQSLYNFFPFLAPHHPATPPADTAILSAPPTGAVVPHAPPAVAAATPAAPSDAETGVAELQEKYSGDIALELLHWIPSLLLVPYITYFFLLDGPRFKRFLVQAIPNAFFEKTLYLFYRVEDQLKRYFQGLLALTALDALCLGVGLWVLGLPAPFFLAILAAVMAWLPYLGSIGGGLLVVLVAASAFPNSNWLPYEVIALFVGVRLLDDFVFLPLTIGRSLRMHPLLTVLMILLGGAVAGIAGLLLVMPVLGVVMVAGQIIGELATDQRILARHFHARRIHLMRARADLFEK
jgi:predicted PurR-regulated permease PerM